MKGVLPTPREDELDTQLARESLRDRLFGESRAPGRIGRYVPLDRVGEGGLGVVYRAYDPDLDRRVALKFVRAELLSDEGSDQQTALMLEARAAAKLSHPNVVQIYDVGDHGGRAFFAMEYVDGTSLRRWLEGDARPWREVVEVFAAAAQGLGAAHDLGLVHRDVKPDNILIDAAGGVKVADFGLARLRASLPELGIRTNADTHRSTLTAGPKGTPAYIAPEVWLGEPATARSDQFSLCVALFEALFGAHPFRHHDMATLVDAVKLGEQVDARGSAVPAWVESIVRRGLARDPAVRYPSMQALVDAFGDDPTARRRRRLLALAMVGVGR